MVTLVACNNAGDEVSYAYGVYIKGVSVDENGQCTAALTRNQTAYLVGESSIDVVFVEKGFWTYYTYTVAFDGSAIFSAVEDALAQDGTLLNGQEYSTLKIIYDYDTIYKSIKSEGVRTKVSGNYAHSFEVDKTPFNTQLTRVMPRQSVWYGVAVAGAVVILAVALTLTYCRGKYGRKQEEN